MKHLKIKDAFATRDFFYSVLYALLMLSQRVVTREPRVEYAY